MFNSFFTVPKSTLHKQKRNRVSIENRQISLKHGFGH